MLILGIDPGPKASGIALLNCVFGRIEESFSEMSNDEVLLHLHRTKADNVAIEMIHNQGRTVVGQETFDTCVWIGRFMERSEANHIPARTILRSKLKMALCGDPRAKDANISQAVRDRLGPKGTKKEPGPTYGVSGHAWQAAAVAIALADAFGAQK